MLKKSILAVSAATSLLLGASPALADDSGLYGSSDPTYDGVYRQALTVLALKATDRKVPAQALQWLKKQQCPDGGFMAYRAAGTPCAAPDPINYAGEDSNSTALAAAALWHAGQKKKARKAAKWLAKNVGDDRGWAYYPAATSTSDVNSTALAVAAQRLVGVKASSAFVRKLQLRCDAPAAQRGGLPFDAATPGANDNATAQAMWALGGGLKLRDAKPVKKATPRLKCKGDKADKASLMTAGRGYLAKRVLSEKGVLPNGGGNPGTDYQGSSWATIALAEARQSRKAVRTGTRAIKRFSGDWSEASGPAALAVMALAADATGEKPSSFAGLNLPRELAKSRTR